MGLDSVELIMAYEEAFGIEIPDGDAAALVTPRVTGDLVEEMLLAEGRPLPRAKIDEMIKSVTLDQLGIRETKYAVDSRFVEDFGVD